jgi:hypothetical protein
MPFAVFDPLEKIEEENTIVKRLDGPSQLELGI